MATDNPGAATLTWAEMVRAEHEQSDRVRRAAPRGDFWKGLAHRFAPTAREEAQRDDTVEALLRLVRQDDIVLDVGAGAGRIALPLAERCRLVTAVEPSEAMREQMVAQAAAWGVSNLRVVAANWEDAVVEPADLVVCSHVIYTVTDIEPFLRKLDSHARRTVAVIVFDRPAMANYYPLWRMVHGEDRLRLPCLPELRGVLDEMGIRHKAAPLAPYGPRPFPDRESARDECMRRLFVASGTDAAERLDAALDESLISVDGGVLFKWAFPNTPSLVTWEPRQR